MHDLTNRLHLPRICRDALAHGALGYYLSGRVIAEEFGLEKDVLADRFHHASA